MKNAQTPDTLFSTLKAEDEPWLADVFVSLPAFERIREERSTILYGGAGSGKTAMLLELKRQHTESVFTVIWRPEPLFEAVTTGTILANYAIKQALRVCVESLVLEGDLPKRLGEASVHIGSALQWFMRNYLPFDPVLYLQDQETILSQEALQWYRKLLERPLPEVIKDQTSLKDQMRLVLVILHAAGYKQFWLAIDGLERWGARRTGEQVEALLEAVLSTLVFFDLPNVAFKFFVPSSLESILHKTRGVERHRSGEANLIWQPDALSEMLERRLANVLSTKKVSLASLCDGEEFLKWLKVYGGSSPRAWLRFTGPLAIEYQKTGKRLTTPQTLEFIRTHPAPLRLRPERREIWLGEKRISTSSSLEFRVLEFLLACPEKLASLEELYYYAYKELDTPPDKGAPAWTHPKTWRGAMDNVIMRIRQKVEPDPKNPIYLVTHHGKGLELLNFEV